MTRTHTPTISRRSSPPPDDSPKAKITATSQQSRFWLQTIDPSSLAEVDLKDVTIAIGELEVLTDAKMLFKSGVRYGLVGRNGTGKSNRIIPGLSPSLRIYLVTQVDPGPENSDVTVLQHVLDGHTERRVALEEREMLNQILETPDHTLAQTLLNELLLRRAETDLVEKRRIALLRSGARGKEARAEEIKAEEVLAEAEEKLKAVKIEDDASLRASQMLEEVQLSLELVRMSKGCGSRQLDADGAESRAFKILRGLGFEEKMIAGKYDDLSGGWRSRCRLATALLVEVDLLMLDEPTNFMDLESVLWLEKYLTTTESFQILLLTSHDQTFLDRVAEQTVALRHKRLDYFDGTPSNMIAVEDEERRNKEKQIAAKDKQREHIESSISEGRKAAKANNDDNRMRMVKSRQKKLDDRWGLEKSAKGTRFKLNRDVTGYHLTARLAIQVEEKEREVRIKLDQPPSVRAMGSLVTLEGVDVGYKTKSGRKRLIVGEVGLVIPQGGRVGFVGANGQGKSTLAKTIMGDLPPLKGSVTRHPSLKIGHFGQHVVEGLTEGEHGQMSSLAYFKAQFETPEASIPESEARTFLGRFGLGPVATVPIESLSGGQKVRLALACIMWKPPNMLILDEVTTHLDAPTIRALATSFKKYEGAILLITHDRWFSTVLIENAPIGDSSEDESSEDEDEAEDSISKERKRGKTYLVDKGKFKVLERGMGEYEELVERRLKRRMKKEGLET